MNVQLTMTTSHSGASSPLDHARMKRDSDRLSETPNSIIARTLVFPVSFSGGNAVPVRLLVEEPCLLPVSPTFPFSMSKMFNRIPARGSSARARNTWSKVYFVLGQVGYVNLSDNHLVTCLQALVRLFSALSIKIVPVLALTTIPFSYAALWEHICKAY